MSFLRNLFRNDPPARPVAAKSEPSRPAVDVSSAGQPIDCAGVEWNIQEQLRFLRGPVAASRDRLATLLHSDIFRDDPQCTDADAAVIFAILAQHEPTRMMQVGAGCMTLAFAHAKQTLHLPGELIAIEPKSPADVSEFVDALLRKPVITVPVEDFAMLQSGELLFVDSSRRLAPGSDSQYLIETILPALNEGVLVGFNGIRLPFEYNADELRRGYSEQAALLKFLQSRPSEILFAGSYLRANYAEESQKNLPGGETTQLWFRLGAP
ncbi:hypothetical protein BH09SUM1_BH09SUM1_17860 [soil metagenome]